LTDRSRKKLSSILLTALLTLSLGPGALVSDGAGAAECSWQRHTKRVVKKVRRHGKVRRVVRFQHRWTCDPVAAAPASSAPATPATQPPAPSPQPNPEEEALPRRVSVKANDDVAEAFSFGLSRPYGGAGEVTVELNNSEGGDPHNLNIRPVGSEAPPLEIPEAGPGEPASAASSCRPGPTSSTAACPSTRNGA
jgi:hypothetical protein